MDEESENELDNTLDLDINLFEYYGKDEAQMASSEFGHEEDDS